jgi:hypothetical protein
MARNSVLNFHGQLVPLTVRVLAIPVVVKVLAVDGFGILSVAWMPLGYRTLFDLGLGLATTKFIAEDVRDAVPPRQSASYTLHARELVRRAGSCGGTILEIVLEFIRHEPIAWALWRCDRCKSCSTSCSECLPNPSGERQQLDETARQLISPATGTT